MDTNVLIQKISKELLKKWSRAKLYTNKGNPSGRKHKTRRRN